MSAEQDLYEWADRLRAIAVKSNASGPEVAEALRGFVDEHAGKGLQPDGAPWAKTQDGQAPLKNAMNHIRTTSDRKGASIYVSGHYAVHDLDRASGSAPHRQVIPHKLSKVLADDIGRRLQKRLASE